MVGYLRVSSLDQKELRQLEGSTLHKRFVDKASGKDLHRPQLEQLTSYVREGDAVICHAMIVLLATWMIYGRSCSASLSAVSTCG